MGYASVKKAVSQVNIMIKTAESIKDELKGIKKGGLRQ